MQRARRQGPRRPQAGGETKLIALEVSASSPASCANTRAIPVIVALTMSAGEKTLQLGSDYRVKSDPDFFAEVKSLLGEAAVV